MTGWQEVVYAQRLKLQLLIYGGTTRHEKPEAYRREK